MPKMHPWLNWIEHLTTDQKVVGSNPTGCTIMKSYIQILFCAIFISGCSIVISKAANIQDINVATGLYSIGTKRMVWVDSTRTNWFLDGYGQNRKLMMQIWYPADSTNLLKKSKYIDNEKALTHTIKLQGYNIPEILTDQIGGIDCNSWENALPLSDDNYPIIIFSHGHGGLRTQNTNQVEELVSHGYIVIAVDHTFDAGFVEFPDGEIIYSLTSRPNDQPLIESPETFYKRFGYRVDDINFILDQITLFDKYDVKISSIMDKNNIGIFGHSFGGLTAFYAGYHDNRIKSCFALDGWFEPLPDTLVLKDINKPIMHLGQNNKGSIQFWKDVNFEKMESFMNNNSNFSVMIDVPGSHHYDYSDFTYFSYLSKMLKFSGDIPTKQMANIMNTMLLDFFDYTLKNKKILALNQYKEKFPEINIIYSNIED